MKRLAWLLLSCACGVAAAADGFVPGSEQDPRVRAADYLAQTNRYMAASSLLLQIQRERPHQQFPPEYFQRLANDTLNFGMPRRAESIDREASERADDPIVRARARLHRAEYLYDRGFLADANAELTSLRQQLPSQLLVSWQDQMSRVLLAQGRYSDAAQTLLRPDTSGDQSAIMRYNLAIALVNSEQAEKGLNVLDRIGQRRALDSETQALRDKANLTLGYYWLKREQGGSAIPIFNRIRTEGPFSNRALLGLGWAYLAPQGDKHKRLRVQEDPGSDDPKHALTTIGAILRPGFLDADIYRRAGLRPFKLNRVDPNDEIQLKRALVPWSELLSRDSMDPAVQEGMLAIPFVLDKLGAHIEAQEYYEKAIPALEQTKANLDQAILSIRYGRMVETIIKYNVDADSGWAWKLKQLPDANETFYLQYLIADHPFQEALKNFRDIRLLIRDTDAQHARIEALEGAYDARVGQSVTPRELQQRLSALSGEAKLGYEPEIKPQLHLSGSLGAPTAEDKSTPAPGAPVKLTAGAPRRFDGPYERLEALKTRLEVLSPKLKSAENSGNQLLQKIALNELDAQRKFNERYLVEARFALARIYDRQAHGGSTP